ncbi:MULTISPECIES: BON domain-containing protein [unclassified Rhizobium]|uniref:BON domain-containing protein n=1 Tax=unclassified Rhizobium TaxID=2613769 RepID=UPI001AD9E6D4|nr:MULTISPECIES: BON domain-containing protein [unclassified Rhizobium]MBO9101335.1 BON domain-containing protein [Rhizobium sp. L58/93]QXZ86874.1 BON domain-containing protein [Rhizobium sp. K1/93]QXZ93093.1 BON domain-containing protein [Rhizobium sp. K15/93]QYA03772.1 BON domain-containing protein [Rhizobium sp. B21/90]
MMFLPYPALAVSASSDCSTRIAIECLLAYTFGHEDCEIEVEVSNGCVTLSGRAHSQSAAARAVEVAGEFTHKAVHSIIEIAPGEPAP